MWAQNGSRDHGPGVTAAADLGGKQPFKQVACLSAAAERSASRRLCLNIVLLVLVLAFQQRAHTFWSAEKPTSDVTYWFSV